MCGPLRPRAPGFSRFQGSSGGNMGIIRGMTCGSIVQSSLYYAQDSSPAGPNRLVRLGPARNHEAGTRKFRISLRESAPGFGPRLNRPKSGDASDYRRKAIVAHPDGTLWSGYAWRFRADRFPQDPSAEGRKLQSLSSHAARDRRCLPQETVASAIRMKSAAYS